MATYFSADLTMIVSLRAHDMNPWALERLALAAEYYQSPLAGVVLDLGSGPEYRKKIEDICAVNGFKYVYLDDRGVYSQAIGRNAAVRAVATELVFFSDVDCLGEPDLFRRLIEQANAIGLASQPDLIVNLPVYHLGEESTASVLEATSPEMRGTRLRSAMARSVRSATGPDIEYIDPFSNFFLCRKDFFEFVGGYNENFRGHGSEDYEFLIRFAHHGHSYPLPAEVTADCYSPVRNSFFASRKEYRGFRRLGEVMAFEAEVAGLRIAHLHHPRGESESSWYRHRDVRRERFEEQLRPFLDDPAARLSYDWCQRDKRAVVLNVQTDRDSEIARSLREQGYRLTGQNKSEYRPELGTALAVFESQRSDSEIQEAVRRASESGCEILWLRDIDEPSTQPQIAPNSYLAGKLGLGLADARVENRGRPADEALGDRILAAPTKFKKRIAKLSRDPHRFLRDSRFAALRAASRAFRSRD